METSEFRVSSLLKVVFVFVGLVLFVTGSFLSVDWTNYFTDSTTNYAAYAKPLVSTLCAVIALLAWKNNLGKRDFWLLAFTFVCIVIVDVTMSIYVYSANKALGASVFYVGAGLSIVAHILLIIRHSKGFGFLKEKASLVSRWGFPLLFFLPVIVIFVILSPFLMSVGQFWPSLIYALILTASLWVAWEAFRHQLFPRANAWLLALGVTSWFACELVGVVHNIDIGPLSNLAMNLTWHFYMPAILLLALSGHRFSNKASKMS
jgi:hypothetical protein